VIALPAWLAVVGPLLAIATVLVGLGRVLSRLDTIATEHSAARAESKLQHEETRREIAGLREARVASDATAEHLRADVNALRDSVREIRAEMVVHTTARHDLRDQVHTIEGAIEEIRRGVTRAARPARGGR